MSFHGEIGPRRSQKLVRLRSSTSLSESARECRDRFDGDQNVGDEDEASKTTLASEEVRSVIAHPLGTSNQRNTPKSDAGAATFEQEAHIDDRVTHFREDERGAHRTAAAASEATITPEQNSNEETTESTDASPNGELNKDGDDSMDDDESKTHQDKKADEGKEKRPKRAKRPKVVRTFSEELLHQFLADEATVNTSRDFSVTHRTDQSEGDVDGIYQEDLGVKRKPRRLWSYSVSSSGGGASSSYSRHNRRYAPPVIFASNGQRRGSNSGRSRRSHDSAVSSISDGYSGFSSVPRSSSQVSTGTHGSGFITNGSSIPPPAPTSVFIPVVRALPPPSSVYVEQDRVVQQHQHSHDQTNRTSSGSNQSTNMTTNPIPLRERTSSSNSGQSRNMASMSSLAALEAPTQNPGGLETWNEIGSSSQMTSTLTLNVPSSSNSPIRTTSSTTSASSISRTPNGSENERLEEASTLARMRDERVRPSTSPPIPQSQPPPRPAIVGTSTATSLSGEDAEQLPPETDDTSSTVISEATCTPIEGEGLDKANNVYANHHGDNLIHRRRRRASTAKPLRTWGLMVCAIICVVPALFLFITLLFNGERDGGSGTPSDESSTTVTSSSPSWVPTAPPTVALDEYLQVLKPFSPPNSFEDVDSPQYQAAFWLANEDRMILLNGNSDAIQQRYALCVLFFSLTLENTDHFLQGWLKPTVHECDWATSIMCDTDNIGLSDNRGVVALDLTRRGLDRGQIPPELGSLGKITSLLLRDNNIVGTMPAELSNLRRLEELDLCENQLTGTISSQVMGAWSGTLTSLDLSFNNFTGPILDDVRSLSALRAFSASHNNFMGTIPEELTNLRQMERFNIIHNRIEGRIPPALLRTMSQLAFFNVDYNLLTGPLPDDSTELLSRREEMTVSNNALTGAFPEFTDMTDLLLFENDLNVWKYRLKRIDVSNNRLSGSLPMRFKSFPSLRVLDCSNNQFSGQIASLELSNSARYLDFSRNQLTGPIPTEYGSFLQHADFGHNMLTGQIPSELGELQDIDYLDLGFNAGVVGSLPSSLKNLEKLKVLRLQNCSLTGQIPSNMDGLIRLEHLFLAHNSLSGELSIAPDTLPKLKTLQLNHNKIFGTLTTTIGKLTSLELLDLAFNDLRGTLPRELQSLGKLSSIRLNGNVRLDGTVSTGLCNLITGCSNLMEVGLDGTGVDCSCCFEEKQHCTSQKSIFQHRAR